MKYLHVKKLLRARTLIINRSILSNRTVTGIVCDCYIRECYISDWSLNTQCMHKSNTRNSDVNSGS